MLIDALHGIYLGLCPICAALTVTLVSMMFSLHVDTVGGSEHAPAAVTKAAARELKRLQTLLQFPDAVMTFFIADKNFD